MSHSSSVRKLVGAEILIVDQDRDVQDGLQRLLGEAKLNVTCVDTPEQALEQIEQRFFSAVLIDLDTPMPSAGLATIALVKDASPTSMIVLLTPRKSFDDGIAAIRAGAIDIVFKHPNSVPYLKDRILAAANRSVDTRVVNALLIEVKSVHDEFFDKLMDAERRVIDLQDRVAGRDPNRSAGISEIRLLIINSDPTLCEQLQRGSKPGYSFHEALSGGQALDLCSSGNYHYALVGESLFDLPSAMVIRSIKTQCPNTVVLAFTGPGPGGAIELVETAKRSSLVPAFTAPAQLLERLDDLAEAFRAKARESRYTQTFRERHYNFLRRFVNLKMKIERTLASE